MERGTIVYVASAAVSLATFLRSHVERLHRDGFAVHVVCGPDDALPGLERSFPVPIHQVPLARRIDPAADLRAVRDLRALLRDLRPDLVHAHTPKAGLVGMVAASLARVPVRIYTVHGLAQQTRTGWRRAALAASERLACRLAHRVLCVSPSLRDEVVAARLCPADKAIVLGDGSVAGVDPVRFDRTAAVADRAADLRAALAVPPGAPVVGYVGRLTRDKGVVELAAAWTELTRRHPAAHLLLVGAFDDTDRVPADVRAALAAGARVHLAGWQDDVVPYLAIMDVLVLPSHREGFGLSLIEAAAMGVPTVASRVTGCVDAVADGETGLLVPPGDPAELARAVDRLLTDPALRARLGAAGRRRAVERFDPDRIWRALRDEYRTRLDRRRR